MLVTALFLVSTAFADPKSMTLEAGRPAPYTGTLLNAEAVANIIAESEAAVARCEAKSLETLTIQEAKLKHDISIATIKNQDCEKKLEELDREHKALSLKYNRLSTMAPIATGAAFVGGIALTLFIAHSM